jgi:hypothetical protein
MMETLKGYQSCITLKIFVKLFHTWIKWFLIFHMFCSYTAHFILINKILFIKKCIYYSILLYDGFLGSMINFMSTWFEFLMISTMNIVFFGYPECWVVEEDWFWDIQKYIPWTFHRIHWIFNVLFVSHTVPHTPPHLDQKILYRSTILY